MILHNCDNFILSSHSRRDNIFLVVKDTERKLILLNYLRDIEILVADSFENAILMSCNLFKNIINYNTSGIVLKVDARNGIIVFLDRNKNKWGDNKKTSSNLIRYSNSQTQINIIIIILF